jgi:ADP-dependent NAD(P)H-hydrate dehydratase / NAD(P)H-hydrate epimerase
MKPLFTSEEMAELDRHTTFDLGVPAEHLMNNAALRVFDFIRERFNRDAKVLVISGPGNNGGDGIALSTFLHRAGWMVDLRIVSASEESKYPTSIFVDIAQKTEVLMHRHIPRGFPEDIWQRHWDVVVDALFGTGLARDLSSDFVHIVEQINSYRASNKCTVLAVDTPSGLCTTTGAIRGACVHADITVTIEHEKLGFHNFASADVLGDFHAVSIGFPVAFEKKALAWKINSNDVAERLPVRDKKSHKGTYGKVLVIGGGKGMTGAAKMAARAALSAGAGMVKLVVPAKVYSEVASTELEVMVECAPDTESGFFSRLALPKILDIADWADCLAIGCGMGRDPQVIDLVRDILAKSDLPVVVDADGIFAFKDEKNPRINKAVGITPHPGEFSMITGKSPRDIERDPFGIARDFAKKTKAIVAFKSGENFVASPEGIIYHSPTGNPGMATAGSGDVLTGIIAGLLAPMASRIRSEGLSDFHEALVTALWAGQYVHGLAGDIASVKLGIDGIIAGDILRYIGPALNRIRAGEDQ